MHLIIDGYGGERGKMEDTDFIHKFLDAYPSTLGMRKITQPYVYTYHGPKPEDWGVSGFVIIAESHISVHTFPERAYLNLDVFSCKEFDAAHALREISQLFELAQTRSWVLDRGLEYSEPTVAAAHLSRERALLTDRRGR